MVGISNGQQTEAGSLVQIGELPPYSVTPVDVSLMKDLGTAEFEPVTATEQLLENGFLRVEFNLAGDIVRIQDKAANREVLPDGTAANQLQAFEDRPLSWDAWDIDIYYDDKMWLAEPATSIKVVDAGPLRGTIEIKRTILNSEFIQRISLDCNSPRLDFHTRIDWQERKILLKAAFPVDVLSPTATYEVQWGNVERPTHRNTSWDWARFETAAQKWVDLSEGGYGVSLLNDCKYGHDIWENVIRLTLLRGTTAPDPNADLGEHEFCYSLLPHEGPWDEKTVSAAYVLNDPLIVYLPDEPWSPGTAMISPLVSVDRQNVVIETIKLTEDRQGIIVRMYESQRKRGNVKLRTSFLIQSAVRVNLMEEEQHSLTLDSEKQVSFEIRPYQILTLRLMPTKGTLS
jgi:alpha-mannosidase